ncbi:sugar ABC transporter substrate-binding protein [Mesorhizobium sp. YR577]|uniref:ABC transporter substrate-binding protein n=1 Tax=Mesorhizobium sp. YR577 TaxID=1884373 RepID=UPI0008F30834|nr:sugar ABC transporter substrate-binding protein [Mesorhizobium sp. YR577]SFU17112.1 carbohydrate ABC transporter substrate-binding protein, CUT1 family [Mesorhizobium sp. YR577]
MDLIAFYARVTRWRALTFAVAAGVISMTVVPVAAQQVTLNFWDMNWGDKAYPAAGQALVERYNKEHPDVQVVYRSVPWSNWYETYVTAIASGSAPDISTGGGFQAVQFYDQGSILPVDDVVKEIGNSEFEASTLDAMKYDDHYVGLPWALNVKVVLYRKDILEAAGIKPPTTFDELRQAAKATTGNGKFGLVAAGDASGAHWITHIAIANGGGLFNKDGTAGLTSERSKEGLQILADMVKDGSVNPASAGYTNNDALGAFFRGEATFVLAGATAASQAGEAKSKIGILPPLKGPHGDIQGLYFVNNIMAYKQTQYPKETMAFMKWWSDNAMSLWTEGHVNNLPARQSIASNPYFTNDPDIKFVLDNYMTGAKTLSQIKGGTFPLLNTIDGDGFLWSLVQSIWQGQPLEAPLDSAQSHLEEVLGK